MEATRDLPEEIVVEILTRLPIKSQARFMCVQKSWHALFQNPTFTTTQARRCPNGYLPVVRKCKPTGKRVISLITPTPRAAVVADIPIPCSGDNSNFRFKIVGSCNGVMCLTTAVGTQTCLFNPVTGEFKKLPEPEFVLSGAEMGVGFGYDPKNGDYNFVRIQDPHQDPVTDQLVSRVDVYSLSSNSWRRLERAVDGVVMDRVSKTCVNGVLYWKATHIGNGSGHPFIMSFHLGTEAFRKIVMPFGLTNTNQNSWNLTTIKNAFALIASHNNKTNPEFEIWVLKQMKWKCVKRIKIDAQIQIQRVVGCCGENGDILVKACSGMALINTNNRRVTDFKIKWLAEPIKVMNYMESLVSINGEKLRGSSRKKHGVSMVFYLFFVAIFCFNVIST